MTVTLRDASPEDRPLVERWLRADPEGASYLGADASTFTPDRDGADSMIDRYVVLDDAGVPVGAIAAEPSLGDGLVLAVLVDPERRGERVASRALGQLIEARLADTFDQTFSALVHKSNRPAIELMRSLGFHEQQDDDEHVDFRFGWPYGI